MVQLRGCTYLSLVLFPMLFWGWVASCLEGQVASGVLSSQELALLLELKVPESEILKLGQDLGLPEHIDDRDFALLGESLDNDYPILRRRLRNRERTLTVATRLHEDYSVADLTINSRQVSTLVPHGFKKISEAANGELFHFSNRDNDGVKDPMEFFVWLTDVTPGETGHLRLWFEVVARTFSASFRSLGYDLSADQPALDVDVDRRDATFQEVVRHSASGERRILMVSLRQIEINGPVIMVGAVVPVRGGTDVPDLWRQRLITMARSLRFVRATAAVAD